MDPQVVDVSIRHQLHELFWPERETLLLRLAGDAELIDRLGAYLLPDELPAMYGSLAYLGTWFDLLAAVDDGPTLLMRRWWDFNLFRRGGVLVSGGRLRWAPSAPESAALARREEAIFEECLPHPGRRGGDRLREALHRLFEPLAAEDPVGVLTLGDRRHRLTLPEFEALDLGQTPGFMLAAELAALYLLARHTAEPSYVLEIGSLAGRSTLALALGSRDARNSRRLLAVDPGSDPLAKPVFEETMARHRVAGLVTLIEEDSREAAARLGETPLSILLIDGDHTLPGVRLDVELHARHVVPGGHLLLHDHYARFPGVMQAASELGAEWSRVNQIDSLLWLRRVG